MTASPSLRGRLMAAMALVLVLAAVASGLMDDADAVLPVHLREPYQDGLVLALFSVPALALIWLVSSWSLRPLRAASDQARHAGPQAPGVRIDRAGLPTEIVPLVEAVNGALDRMAAAVAAERRFTENAAHELRTPLAVLKLRLQRAKQDAALDWPAIENDMAQMQRLVSQLLELARSEHADAREKVNLARVAREAAASVLPLAEARGRTLTVALPDTLPVRASADALQSAVRNLLENALLHGAGTVTLSAETGGAEAALVVGDEGPGIPPALRAAVFGRFIKGNPAAGGSGLGLSIVQEVARAHGGQVELLDGPGCRLRLAVPAAQAARDAPARGE